MGIELLDPVCNAAFEVLQCAIHTVVLRQHLRPVPTTMTIVVMMVVTMVVMII
jgi:hypothetical protein